MLLFQRRVPGFFGQLDNGLEIGIPAFNVRDALDLTLDRSLLAAQPRGGLGVFPKVRMRDL